MKNTLNSKKIPITVIQGFLGSGKTTLLNYILQNNQGLNIGVVVNDFGDINIDSKLVKSKTDKQLELTSGCICCSLQTLDLQEAIDQFTFKGSNIDHIIIEASGLAEPRDLAMTLRQTIGVNVRLDGIVTVLDAENIKKNAKQFSTARDQIIFTDYIVINKIDLVKKAAIDDIVNLIHSFNPKARILESTNAQVDIRLLLELNSTPSNQTQAKALSSAKSIQSKKHDHSHHLHHQFSSLSWSTAKPLDPVKFQNFVNRLLPVSVYRAKGIVNLGIKGHMRRYIFHLVGVRAEITWDNWKNQAPTTEIVFIGQDIDSKKLKADLQDCIDDQPNEPMQNGMELKLPKKSDY